MLKLITKILISVLALTTLGCTPSVKPQYRIGLSQCSDDPWRANMNSEMSHEALLYDNVEFIIRSAGSSSARQISDIDSFIQDKVDLLIVSPNESEPITAAVEKAYMSGIPVIVADRKVFTDSLTAFVGADNYHIGRSIGIYVSKLLDKGGKVVELTGSMSTTPAIERHDGFMKGISQNSAIHLLCSRDAQWEREKAYEEMMKVLAEYDDIDLVYSHNDETAYGAYLAAKSVGLEKNMSFIGIDALPGPEGGVSMVLSGILDATFIYPSGGDKIIQLAMKILQGEHYPKSVSLSTAIVDKSNASLMDLQYRHISEQESKLKTLNSKLTSLSASYSRQQFFLYLIGSMVCISVILLFILQLLLRQRNQLNSELTRRNEEIEIKNRQTEAQRDKLVELSRQLEDATQAKLTFFTNVSHEFKTPLTLIADPINLLLQTKGLDEHQKYLLNTILENVNVLKDLVNQILDFRKYDRGDQTLKLSRVDLLSSVKYWSDAFQPAIIGKHLKFHLSQDDGTFEIAGDSQKIERIYYNLLSNAMKFTPAGGRISVSLKHTEEKDSVLLSVTNSGSYISEENQKRIFDRFFTSDKVNAGTGIGLTLVKIFTEMHGGNVKVQSDKNGTTFMVLLPKGNPDALIEDTSMQSDLTPTQVTQKSIEEEVMSHEHSCSILVIDDNESIRTYMSRLLQEQFYVIEAKDGKDGFLKAMQYVPNLIVSDVMMPGMDGFELCRKLKEEVQTCHIPIILLTAYSMEKNHLDAYEAGADSYIPKPFSSDVLIARIHNLLESRVRIKAGSDDILTLGNKKVENMDRTFMSRLKTVIDQNIINSELSVEFISSELGMSRVQLYRKVKMLTNFSPNEYLRIRRLKKAREILLKTDLTIAEVCYETGFTSPSYFSKCYKDYYNESPSDYLKRLKLDT